MAPGDVFITNDPWMGTGHLNDIVVVTPTFRGADAVALFACTLHVVDIGGRGVPGAASQVYEEGLNLPIMKLVAQGRMNDPLIELIAANVREPIQVVGDIYSEVACNEIGGRRLLEMMAEYRPDRHRGTLQLHPRSFARREPGGDSRAALRHLSQHDDGGWDRQAARSLCDADHRGGRDRRRFHRHVRDFGQGHQRAAVLHRGLYQLRREVHRRAAHSEQRGLARHYSRHGAGRMHPERAASGGGAGAAHHGPDAAGRRVRLPAPGDSRTACRPKARRACGTSG